MNITYPKLGRALNRTGRPIVYSCSWPDYVRTKYGDSAIDYDLLGTYCNSWRIYNDIYAAYDSMRAIIEWWRTANSRDASVPSPTYAAFQASSRPGAFNDADMILVGGTALS